jgi:hypothetical protein
MFLRDQLIDSYAEIRNHRVPPRPGAGKDICAARVITAGFFGSGEAGSGIESVIKTTRIAERLQRFRYVRELEVPALLQRTPIAGRGAMRMPYSDNLLIEPGAAAVCRWGVCAGSIESNNGSANVTPAPRGTSVGDVLSVMIMVYPPAFILI